MTTTPHVKSRDKRFCAQCFFHGKKLELSADGSCPNYHCPLYVQGYKQRPDGMQDVPPVEYRAETIDDLRAECSRLREQIGEAPRSDERTKLVRVAVELLPDLREWSGPVSFRVSGERDGELTLEIRREFGRQTDTERMDWLSQQAGAAMGSTNGFTQIQVIPVASECAVGDCHYVTVGDCWTNPLADATLREAIDAARLAHPSQRAVETPLPQTTESSNG